MREKKGGTFIIYMGSRRGIYTDIAASRSNVFRPRQQNSLGQGRALGPSALGHGPALGNFVASDEKNSPCRGYIGVYSPPGPHIYITYIKYIYPT